MNTNKVTKIRQTPLGEIKPWPENANTHGPEQIEILADLMDENGWTNPILLDANDFIIAGEGRYMAAMLRGRLTCPTMTADWLTQTQVDKLRFADNAIAELSTWDPLLTASGLAALSGVDDTFQAVSLGFKTKDLRNLGALDPVKSKKKTPPQLALEHEQDALTFLVQCEDEDDYESLKAELLDRDYTIFE